MIQLADKYNLEERTAKFGEEIIKLCKTIPLTPITIPLITQLVKASSSIGANYCEADDAESKSDFRHKIGICKKESRESKHFIRILVSSNSEIRPKAIVLWDEARQLNLIFNTIYKKVKKK